jgi:hypothetical protein
MRRALASLLLAAACAGPGGPRSAPAAPAVTAAGGGGPSFRYRTAGQSSGQAPLWARPLSGGRVEYQVLSAARGNGLVTVERALVNRGDDPVRVDLGRIRLRTASGDEADLAEACAGAECHEGGVAHGQILDVEPGQTVRLRAQFGPVPADEPLEKVTFVDEGTYVSGRLALVAVELERP